jgi:hypothetical protein
VEALTCASEQRSARSKGAKEQRSKEQGAHAGEEGETYVHTLPRHMSTRKEDMQKKKERRDAPFG